MFLVFYQYCVAFSINFLCRYQVTIALISVLVPDYNMCKTSLCSHYFAQLRTGDVWN